MRNSPLEASNEALNALVERLTDIRREYLPQSHIIIGLDEAQSTARLYSNRFMHLPSRENLGQSSAK